MGSSANHLRRDILRVSCRLIHEDRRDVGNAFVSGVSYPGACTRHMREERSAIHLQLLTGSPDNKIAESKPQHVAIASISKVI